MTDFSRVALVWGENVSEGDLPRSPSVGVALWAEVLDCPVLRWEDGDMPDVSGYDVFLVNLFWTPDSTHIEQIRRAKPNAKIVAMPDPPVDMVLEHPEWTPMLCQMKHADVIGGRTAHDNNVYGALLNKPTFWMPSPIGRTEDFAPLRELPKEDYIITQDHGWGSSVTAQNVAALALIQRATGLKVIYAAAHEHTVKYAELAGLSATFIHERMDFWEFAQMTARARLCVDLYARHSYHRHAMVCAMVGTPLVGSEWGCMAGQQTVNPFNPYAAANIAQHLLRSEVFYETTRRAAWELVERLYGFEASKRRALKLVGDVL